MTQLDIEWKGGEVYKNTVSACKRAINGLMSECVQAAKVWVPVRTSILQGSIQMRPAVEEGFGIVTGRWGSFSVKYAIYVEKGTRPFTIANGFGRGITIRHPGMKARPYLIPAAEIYHPKLAERIRGELAS